MCVALFSAGCDSREGGKSASGASAASSRSEPAKRVGPQWKVGETDLPIASAIALGAEDQQAWMFRISTGPQECPSAGTKFSATPCPDGSRCLELWYAPMLGDSADGRWEFVSAFLARGGDRRAGRVTAELIRAVEEEGATVGLRSLDMRLTDEEEMSFEGDVVAKKCPRLTRVEPAMEKASELSLSISGRTLVVRGAVLIHRDGHPILRLSTAPLDCATVSREGIDVLVDLALRDDGSKLRFLSLGGARVHGDPASSEAKDAFTVKLDGELEGEGSVPAHLKGTLDVQGHRVQLSGTVVAKRCAAPRVGPG